MATYHVFASVISKGKTPGGSAGFAAYLERRDPEHATRALAYLTRDGQETEDLVKSDSVHLPGWAKNGDHFWRMADRYERGGALRHGVVARHYQITLPRALSEQGRLDVADDLRAVFFARYAHTYAVHCPPARDGSGENPHLHVMVSPRRDAAERATSPKAWFSATAVGAHKDRFWDEKRALQGIRHETAVLINAALEREGIETAVSCDRLRGQGHGRSGVHYRQDDTPDAMARVQAQQAALRAQGVQEIEQAINVVAWHQQKAREGITDISREAIVDYVRDRFWLHDRSAAREAEREASLVRALEREWARTGRASTGAQHREERTRQPARSGPGPWDRSREDDRMREGVHVRHVEPVWEQGR